ncbi:hypothetical protein IJ818_07270 [bacterium]|nr:hypothetical protein [bacterium]
MSSIVIVSSNLNVIAGVSFSVSYSSRASTRAVFAETVPVVKFIYTYKYY